MSDEVDIAELWRRKGVPDWEFRVTFGSTTVDYDPEKDVVNRKVHGYSLESAVAFLREISLPFAKRPKATSEGFLENGEVRHMHMTTDDSGHVVLFVTTMRPNETVRLISYRRASSIERETFRRETGYTEPPAQ